MKFEFNEKITSKDFSKLLNNDWHKLLTKDPDVHFDLVKLEWITGEAITFLFSFINYLKSIGFRIKVTMPNPGNLVNTINKEKNKRNRRKRLASLIDVWKIDIVCDLKLGSEIIVPSNHNKLIDQERKKYKYIDSSWFKILPFQKLKVPIFKNINNIREHLDDKLDEVYLLKKDTLEILNGFNSNKPFENQTLSHLLTTELFLNTIFHSDSNECYFSIVLNSKYDETIEKEKLLNQGNSEEEAIRKAKDKVIWLKRNILPKSVIEERDDQILNFFSINGNFVNRNYLEFNYIDFGKGIPTTLEREFDKYQNYLNELKIKSPSKYKEEIPKLILIHKTGNAITKDSKILEFAFLLDSSKEPFEESLKIKDYMPRGLFFLIEVIKRYEGLIIIRSKQGNITYDFSDSRETIKALRTDNVDYSFPGTMITIFLPNESKNGNIIENTEGAIEYENYNIKKGNGKVRHSHISIGQILSTAFERIDFITDKSKLNYALYTELFKGLNKRLKAENENRERRIVYVDFAGINQSFIESKIFFYLVNTPYINENHTNVIIINISNKYVDRLKEIQGLIRNTKPFHFRPIPCVIHTKNTGIRILWLGVLNRLDENKLTDLLLSSPENDFVSISEMKNPDLIHGNFFRINWVNRKDNSGNVFLNYFPDLNEIKYESCFRISSRLAKNIKNYDLVWLHKKETAYLTSGGKYQYQFLNFIELLATFGKDGTTFYSKQIARYIVNKWLFDNKELPSRIDWIVSVTLSGQILAREILNEIKVFYKDEENIPSLIRLAHYYEFENEEYGLNSISNGDTTIIVTDVISTGDLLERLTKSIKSRGGKVLRYLSIADIRNMEKYNNPMINDRLTTLILSSDFNNDADFDFNKYEAIKNYHKEVIRINPIINAPVSIKLSERKKINHNILFSFKEFINEHITDDYLLIGYFKNNNTFHSYFFDTNNYFKSKIGKQFFSKLIEKCSKITSKKKHDVVAFPIFSGIENIGEFSLKEILLEHDFIKNDSIIIPLPRVDTPKGWRFSFPPESLNDKIKGNILLIDDGSLSGETLIQMIDSISFYSVSSITLISVFGRLRDFQKEFFSQIKGLINVQNGIKVIFGIHAHIPYYPFNKSFPLQQEYNELRNIDLKEIKIEEEKQYILKRIDEISAKVLYSKKTDLTINLKYFPKKSNGEIDRKRIYILRDAIGKLEHYRLYKEYYSDFSIEDEKEYELLLAIVLHEPSLISIVRNLLPEVYKKLQSIINLNAIVNKETRFSYKWEIESLIRLMFIFNRDTFFKEDTIILLAKLSLKNEYLQGYLIFEYNKILKEQSTESLTLKNKLYTASSILTENNLFDKSFIKPLLRNYENIKNNNVQNAFAKLMDSVYKQKILPGHSRFVEVKSPIITNLKNHNKKINRNKLNNLSELIQEELLEPLYMIKKCDEFFPIKNKIFKDKDSPIYIFEQLKEKIEKINDDAYDQRSQLADEIKNFVDNFASNDSNLRLFLSKYPTNVKESIFLVSENEKYKTSLINFNLSELNDCGTILPIHSFYFELIIKEVFDNIIQEFDNINVDLSYRFDDNFFAIKQNRPFIDKKKKPGGLFYIKNITELFGGLFEQKKHREFYEIKFIFN